MPRVQCICHVLNNVCSVDGNFSGGFAEWQNVICPVTNWQWDGTFPWLCVHVTALSSETSDSDKNGINQPAHQTRNALCSDPKPPFPILLSHKSTMYMRINTASKDRHRDVSGKNSPKAFCQKYNCCKKQKTLKCLYKYHPLKTILAEPWCDCFGCTTSIKFHCLALLEPITHFFNDTIKQKLTYLCCRVLLLWAWWLLWCCWSLGQ